MVRRTYMKKFWIFFIMTLATIFLFQSLSLAAQPPEKFMNYNLRSVYHGMGDGGTQDFGITVREFVELGLSKGNWERVNDEQWNYKIRTIDNVTKEVMNTVFVFSRYKGDKSSEEFFKNDVILTRIVSNDYDLRDREIAAFAFKTSIQVFPQTEKGKQQSLNEKKKRDEEVRQKEEEAKKKAAELSILKQNIYNSIQGEYAYSDKREDLRGILTVKLISQDTIQIDGKIGSIGGKACVLKGKIGKLVFKGEQYTTVIRNDEELNIGGGRSVKGEYDIYVSFGINKVYLDENGKYDHCWHGSFLKDNVMAQNALRDLNAGDASNNQKLMNLQGHYEKRKNRNSDKNNGEIDITIKSESEIIINVSTSSPESCKLVNKSAKLSHDNYEYFKAELNETDCKILLRFKDIYLDGEHKSAIEITRSKCNYCAEKGIIAGVFYKSN